MRLLFPALLFSVTVSAQAAEAPMPVRDEPHHQVVLENDYVRVIDVQIPAGGVTLYHRHVLPSVIVYLTKSTNSSQSWGESSATSRDVSPGESRYAAYDAKPLSHRVTNTGAGLFRVLDIELIRPVPATAPFPLAASAAVEPRWEEQRVRSLQVHLAAAAQSDVPASACAHLLIVTRGEMKLVFRPSGRAPIVTQAQQYVFVESQTGFQLHNPGQEQAESVLLELK